MTARAAWLLAAVLLAGCARATGTSSPAPTVTITPTAAPSPTPAAAFAGSLSVTSTVRYGGTITVTAKVRNVGKRSGSAYFASIGLTDSAPLLGCTPQCTDHGGSFGVDVVQFSAVKPDALGTYVMKYQAQKTGSLSFVVSVSAQPNQAYPLGDQSWQGTVLVLL